LVDLPVQAQLRAPHRHGFHHRTAKWYLSTFAEAGLTALGSHCYLAQRLVESIAALEAPALF